MTSFSDVPLQLATLFGILIAQLSALGAVVILVLDAGRRRASGRVAVGAGRGAVPSAACS